MESLEGIIARHPLFQSLKPEHLRALAGVAMQVSFAKDEPIFREGDTANRFYLLLDGDVAIESRKASGETVILQHVRGGDVLGWSWLFPPFQWNFDARAVVPTTAVFFYATRLREKCEDDPALGYALMKRMSEVMLQRLQSARRKLCERL